MAESRLNPGQFAAATAVDVHALVTAGAGTGKTRTVVGRILYLLGTPLDGHTLNTPVPLRRIAAVTYTNAAAADLVDKLRTSLRAAGRPDLAWEVDTARIGTIHRFCGELLREFALRRGGNPAPDVIEEGEARALAAGAAGDALLAALERGDVPGWEQIVTEHGANKVVGYIERLLDRSDVLRRLHAGGNGVSGPERALITVALRALTILEDRLDELGLIDFDRMLTWSRDLLRDDLGARAALRRKLHTLIVDEFQDVDPVQQELAYLVGDPLSRDSSTPRLMLVGDAKQSIYRFRYADVAGWRRVERHFAAGAGRIFALTENYRSTDAILGLADHVIGPALDTAIADERADDEIAFSPVTPAKADQMNGAPAELVVVPDSAGLKLDDVRAIEAEWIARRARQLHEEGVPWGKMAVLLPAWSPAERIRDALRRRGAPVWIARDEGLLECREVVDCIVGLEAVRDPEDDRALFGFLRSPFVGVPDETLFAVADAVYPPYWRRLGSIDVPAAERFRAGVTLLGRLVALRDRVTVDELLDELLDATGYIAHLALQGGERDQAIANVRKFARMARGLKHAGLGEFLKGIAEIRERHDRVPQAVLHGEHEDVVTIASIHTAKGLEWDVVFWSDVSRNSAPFNEPLLVRPDSIRLKRGDDDAWKQWVAREGHEQLAERKRLWYVAATRARRRLIVSALHGDYAKLKPDQAAHWLVRGLRDIPETEGGTFRYTSAGGAEFEGIVRVADPDEYAVLQADDQPPPLGTLETLAAPRNPILVPLGRPRHSATSMLAFSRCERRHWFKYIMGLREPPVDRGGPAFISAVARGQIVHDVLEQYREEDELDSLLEDAIGRWDEDAPPAETPEGTRYRDHLREEVGLVAHHPDYRAVADRREAQREQRFLHVTRDGEAFEGAIDLMAPDGDRIVLLDVKTAQQQNADAVRRLAERYGPQRDVYVSAVEAIAGREVSRFAFQFSRAATQVGETIDDEKRSAIARTVDERLTRLGSDRPRLTEHPSECYYCGYKKVGWCEGARRVSEA